MHSVKEWWIERIDPHKIGPSRKAMASLALLVSWDIWKESNARVFSKPFDNLDHACEKIKDEVAMWCLAGAKGLCNIMPRE
jgi:hypothetical protein